MSKPKITIIERKEDQDLSQGFRNWRYAESLYMPSTNIVISATEKGYYNLIGNEEKFKPYQEGDVVQFVKNHPDLNIYNGDHGILVMDPDNEDKLVVEINLEGDYLPFDKKDFKKANEYSFKNIEGRSFNRIIVNTEDVSNDEKMDKLFNSIIVTSEDVTLIGTKESLLKFVGQENSNDLDYNALIAKASYVTGSAYKGIYWDVENVKLNDRPVDPNEFRMPDGFDQTGFPIWKP